MQSSRGLRPLPAILLLCLASAGSAQVRWRVTGEGEWLHATPGVTRLARLVRGTVLRDAGTAEGEWQRVALEGWIFGRSVGAASRDGFDLAVTQAPEENLRAAANGAVLARVVRGMQLQRVAEEAGWVQVRREGWVRRAALEALSQPAATRTAGDTAPRAAETAAPVDPALAGTVREAVLYRAPDGAPAGAVTPETPLRVLGRSGEWTRVQLEAWVKTADLRAAPPGVLVGVTAAELRADPARYRGQVLRWTLQYLAADTADDLRPDIPAGATYLLAKGPLPERGFVYVVVADSQRPRVNALPPLTTVVVTARVRAGRSRFLGHPVVDLLSLEAQP